MNSNNGNLTPVDAHALARTLIVQQEAGGLITPVTLGSSTTTLSARWYAELIRCHTILVAYDRDAAGRNGARRLLTLCRAFGRSPVPQGNDISDFYLNGGDVYRWVKASLQPGRKEVSP